MQEVDSVTNRNGRVDQMKELGALTGMYQCFGNNFPYDRGLRKIRPPGLPPFTLITGAKTSVLQVTDLLQKIVAKKEGATSIAGDFNAVPEAASIGLMQGDYKRLMTSGSAYTFPSDKPRIQIDYIFLPAEHRWKVLRQEVLNEANASDHRPVLVTIKLKNRTPPVG